MSHSWLTRKRKGELIELAGKAGLPEADSYLKDDLVELLQEHLNSNESTYNRNPLFRDYYGRSATPSKGGRSSPSLPVETAVVKGTRRKTIVEDPPAEPKPAKPLSSSPLATHISRPMDPPRVVSLAARTPLPVSRRVSEILNGTEYPASPAQLAEVADQSMQAVKAKTSELWSRTNIDYFKEVVRENASSVAAIQTLILLLEATGLQWNTLQWMPTVNLGDSLSTYTGSQFLFVPDFLALLTSDWWAPATLWSVTNWVLPLIFSYFFNLTLRSNTNRKSADRQYPTDPLTFNILKAILAYSAYRIPFVDPTLLVQGDHLISYDSSWGPFSADTVQKVRGNVPGGYAGLQIGALVGVLVSLYDAALKK